MSCGRVLLLGLLAVLLSGCVQAQKHTTAWLDKFRHWGGVQGADVVQMDVALVQRSLGDPYLNRGLWTVADEQVVALENKADLEDNGFRIGQIGGITPVELQTLLTSERSCANPRRIQLRSGKSTQLHLGPERPTSEFRIVHNGQPVSVSLLRAQCTLELTATLTEDGRTCLRFTPLMQHGSASLIPRPTPDRSGWMLVQDRPTHRYEDLEWEVTLAPNEYVVIGGRADRPESLGHQCFLRKDEPSPVQRLLVIRTGRSSHPIGSADPLLAGAGHPRSPSLACQAAWTKVRGSDE